MEDRRGMSGGRVAAGGGLGLLVMIILSLVFGVDPTALLQGGGGAPAGPQPEAGPPPPGDTAAAEVSVVLAETEDTWSRIFQEEGAVYQEPTLVLFDGAVQSACGYAGSAVGPFYCPGDRQVYLDLSFFRELDRSLGAPGDFARAYVVAHEVGHHVQTLIGVSDQVRAAQQRASREEANAIQVRMELQADCFAGVWAHDASREKAFLEPGDIEEALGAASAIGDDRLQRRSQGYVVPESFTHGTSEQRVRWFRRGFDTGDPDACETFG